MGGGGGGRFTRGAAMYAKLFELRRGVQSAYDGGGGGGGWVGGCSPLTMGGGVQSTHDGGGGGGGAVGKSHSLLKHKEHHGKRVHSAPALSCSTASLTFVRTTELSGLLSMAQHVICRSLSSGRGGGRQKLPGGGISYAMGGAAAPPKAMLDPGLVRACERKL